MSQKPIVLESKDGTIVGSFRPVGYICSVDDSEDLSVEAVRDEDIPQNNSLPVYEILWNRYYEGEAVYRVIVVDKRYDIVNGKFLDADDSFDPVFYHGLKPKSD